MSMLWALAVAALLLWPAPTPFVRGSSEPLLPGQAYIAGQPGYAPEDGFLTTEDGIRLYYRVLGSGPDTVVIPLASWWRPYVAPLEEGRTLILYDPRDRGRSEAVRDSTRLGLEYELRDMDAVRRSFGLERMDLIGWSYLGGVVAVYAARHPERINRLVLVAPVPPRFNPYVPDVFADMAARADTARERTLAEARRAGLPRSDPVRYCDLYWRASVARQLGNKAALDRVMSAGFCDLSNEWPANFGFRHVLRSMGQWDWREQVGAFSRPVLVIHGARDNMPLAGSREWARAFPDARLLVIPGAGHYPMAEAGAEVAEAIDRFLAGEWPGSASGGV